MKSKGARCAGFTHVELVTVMSVMSVLAAVAWPKFSDLGNEARHATMQALASTLSQASVLNGAQGQLRATAEPVRACRDAGRLLVNASMAEDRLHWEGRELALEDGRNTTTSGSHLECVLSDRKNAAVDPVRFFIKVCSDRDCRDT